MKNNLIAMFLCVCGIDSSLFAQTNYNREESFNGIGQASGSCVLALSDGGLLRVGSIGSQQDVTKGDILIIRSDDSGQAVWAKQYNSPDYTIPNPLGPLFPDIQTARMEYAVGAVEVSDGYVVAGIYDHYEAYTALLCCPNNHLLSARFDYLLFKIGKDGSLQWAKRYGDAGTDFSTGIQKTPDGGFILSGFSQAQWLWSGNQPSPFFLKLDASGNVQWSRVLHGFSQDAAAFFLAGSRRMPIVPLSNGDYAAVASTGKETFLIRLSASGNTKWAKSLNHGDAASQIDDNCNCGAGLAYAAFFHSIVELPDGNLAFVGNFGFATGLVWDQPGTDGLDGLFFGSSFGWYLETTAEGAFTRNAIIVHPNDNPNPAPGQFVPSDYASTDAKLLPNDHLLITGANSGTTLLNEYDPNASDNGKIPWSKRFVSYNYSGIPYGYDLPSSAIRGNDVWVLTDNFKLGQTSIAGSPDACHPDENVQAAALPAQNLSDFTPVFSSQDLSADVALDVTDIQIAGAFSCSTVATNEPKGLPNLSVHPLPLSGQLLSIVLDVTKPGTYDCTLRDQIGRVAANCLVTLPAGPQSFEIKLSVPEGLYYLTLSGPERFAVQKVLKTN